jgi:uncharacterized RDD family membrane protein YckC
MFCSKCGANVTDGAAFCSACGQPTSAVTPVASAPARPASALPSPYAPPALAPIPPSPYAGFWLRVVAFLIDRVLLAIACGVLASIGLAIVGVEYFRTMFQGMNGDNPAIPVAFISTIFFLLLVILLLSWIYEAGMEGSKHQATLGKMALGLFVTDLQGRPLSFAHASGRFFAAFITRLIPFGIGYAMAGFTEKKQALHDMIASCLVLRKT